MYHPDTESISGVSLIGSIFHTPRKASVTYKCKITQTVALSKPTSKIDKLFSKPVPPSKLPTKTEKSSGRVLTSSEALKLLQEKEEKKDAANQKKELCQKKAEKKLQQQSHAHINHDGTIEEGIKRKDNQGTVCIEDHIILATTYRATIGKILSTFRPCQLNQLFHRPTFYID